MEITIPHAFQPRDYQIKLLSAKARFKVAVWHRRAGKSKTVLNQQVIRTQLKKGIYYYILPTYSQAKRVMWDSLVREHIPPEIIDKKNDSELAIYYKNGSIQRFVGAENPDSHRGSNPCDVVFDEYSEQPEEIWTAIFQPVLRENKGTATFIFTPKGKNHSWKLLQLGKDNPEEWFTSVLSVDDTNTFTNEELDEIRRNTPQSLFEQEYKCSFLDGAGQFFRRVRANLYPVDTPLTEQGDFQLGVDLAKYQDWTVITPFNLNHFVAYPQERFNQVDWNLQKARIEAGARRFSNALVWPDATGVGDPVVEDLRSRGIRIGGENQEGFKFTEVSRMNLLNNLAILLEQDKIKIPNDEGLLTELESFKYTLTETGRIKVVVPDNMTDDRVMSLALSVWGVRDPIRTSYFDVNRVEQNRANANRFK
jgi:phage FluMu gp28-like protein